MLEIFLSLVLSLLFAIAGAFAIAYIAASVFLFRRQNRFIFKPYRIIRTLPSAFNLDYEDVWISVPTASGRIDRLHGWWIAGAVPEAEVWLYLHGNGSTIGDELKRAFWFHQLGYSTLMIDYRGYGRSEGKFPTEFSVYEDVEATWTYLTQVRQIPPERIFLYGYSLGGAIAIEMAQRHPEIAGLVVEGTFTTMRSMVDHLYRQFGIFPVDLLLHQHFNSLNKVRSLSMPILFIHGTRDRVVPASMSQTLFEAASDPKKLLLVSEAGHHDVGELAGEQYFQAIQWVVEQADARRSQLTPR